MAEQSSDRVGVTVLSGFLGSGKTTLLRRLVSDPELGPGLAVIVNDLGELGLDHELIADAGDANQTPTLRITELTSGCVCCTLRSDLSSALMDLARGVGLPRPPRHILIEPSGIARASEVSFAVNALSFDGPVRTDAVVTLVDAHNALRSHREHLELFEDQVRNADLILLNKRDLVPGADEREAVERLVAELSPRAARIWTERAAVSPSLLLGQLELAGRNEPAPGQEHEPEHAHEHAHTHAHAHAPTAPTSAQPAAHGITALTVPLAAGQALDYAALEDFLDAQADRIFRIKGIVDVVPIGAPAAGTGGSEAADAVPHLVQAVGDRVEIDALPPGSPLARASRRLLFIGDVVTLKGAEADLRAGLAACARGGSRTRTPCG
ncbi:MAG: CobW family GTP-binding protein [Polyangia bacterium]